MQLLIDPALDQARWDASLLERPDHHFLQSWAWGQFQQALGNPIWRLAVEQEGQLILQLLVVKQSLGFNQSILYSPRGQLVSKQLSAQSFEQAAKLLLSEVTRLARQESCILFRIDPPTQASDITAIAYYKSLGFVVNPKKPIQPQYNRVIHLDKDLPSILAQTKSKTRYNIGLSRKEESLITQSLIQTKEIESFLKLTRQTASRQGFAVHSDDYYRTQIQVLHQAGMLDLITAITHDTIIAAILVVYFGKTATYIHGASDSLHRSLMAPYLLHYQAICKAKEHGMDYYDLGGVHPAASHKWAGITRFKEGFGGTTIQYIGTLELPINPLLYKLYRLVDLIR